MAKDYNESARGVKRSDPIPDADRAADFLENIASGLPITVAAIVPDAGGPGGSTFTLPADRDRLRAWVAERLDTSNLYYSLNAAAGGAPRVGRAGRLAEADVTHIRGVAVDLDPRADQPLAVERERLFGLVQRAEQYVYGAPTAVVDSGGGVQMLWLFPEPLACEPETVASVKAQARGLGAAFGSDPVHSLDHLFRLPFTRNLPDARKRQRGRVATVAATWSLQSGVRLDLVDLRHLAPPIGADERGPAARFEIDYADVLETLGEPEHLPRHLSAAAYDCIASFEAIVGDATGDRSVTDHRVAAHLIRKHRLTDPTDLARVTFAISPQKLEEREAHGSGEDYCARTIARALRGNFPDPDPHDFFAPATGEDLGRVAELQAMFGAQGASVRPRIEVLKRSDIRRLRPPDFVIARHLPEASLGFLYGAPGSGKSFVAIDWAMHMATDRPDWHGDKIVAKRKGWVVYLAREGASGMSMRLEAWERKHIPFAEEEARFALVPSAIDFMKPGDIAATVDAVHAAGVHTVSMIVVDTVSRSMPGADENLQKDMTTFVAACDRLKDEFGCIVLGVHHASKSGDMRGSTVFRGAGDFVFRVGKAESEKSGPDAKRINLFCDKMKEGADGWGADYWLDHVELGRKDASGQELGSLVLRRAPAVERSEGEARIAGAWVAIVMGALGDRADAPWSELREAVGTAARAQGLVRADTGQRLREAAASHLGRLGADVPGPNGQIVNVSMQQAARGKPWRVKQNVVMAPDEALSDRGPVATK